MPDALERLVVLARFHSNVSPADKHSNVKACQVISGNVFAVCLKSLYQAAAQQALAVDAASRPQDQGYFECSIRLESHSDREVRRN
jgi:hypothetical protein